MTKRRKTHNEQLKWQSQKDEEFIPLPIQTFLWCQTSPFLGHGREMAQNEQRDACKVLEGIIVTNHTYGHSPSLVDAIKSIDRWRLVKVSFPFVLQCTAALLNKKLARDHHFNRLNGNEAKMMYTLQWILMEASRECADGERESNARANNAAIAAANAASLLRPSAAPTTTNLASATTSAASYATLTGTGSAGIETSVLQGAMAEGPVARAGSSSSHVNQPVIIPVAGVAAAASALAVGAPSSGHHFHLQTGPHHSGPAGVPAPLNLPSSSSASVSPIGSSSPTRQPRPATCSINTPAETEPPPTPNPAGLAAGSPAQPIPVYLLPVSSIQMFVYYFAPIMEHLKHSDFLVTNQRLEIGISLWEPLFNHQLPNFQCLVAPIKAPANAQPCQQLPNQDSEMTFFPAASGGQRSSVAGLPTTATSSSATNFHQPQLDSNAHNGLQNARRSSAAVLQEQLQYGDVFLGTTPVQGTTTTDPSSADGALGARRHHHHATSETPSENDQVPRSGRPVVSYATYLDVAVLRCLFISDWQESGVYWAITYLSNRMAEMSYTRTDYSSNPRAKKPKSKSLTNIYQEFAPKSMFIHENKENSASVRTTKQSANRKVPNIKLTKLAQTKHSSIDKSSRTTANEQSSLYAAGKQLRVDDSCADSDQNGPDQANSINPPKSPFRRLSISSGVQNLANQIKKTSKRTKKSSHNNNNNNQNISEAPGFTTIKGSQQSIDKGASEEDKRIAPPPSYPSKGRRSSSADDISLGQLSNMSALNNDFVVEIDAELAVSNDKTSLKSNPVITVTENSTQGDSIDKPARNQETENVMPDKPAPLDEQDHFLNNRFFIDRLYSKSLKRMNHLSRSQSVPKNLSYSVYESRHDYARRSENSIASLYVDESGRLNLLVVLKVLHSISQRDSVCSQRVCDKILALSTNLINLGILRGSLLCSPSTEERKNNAKSLPTHQYEFSLLNNASHSLDLNSDQNLNRQQHLEEYQQKVVLIHHILIDIVLRLYHHIGCPNHCGYESTVVQHRRNNQLKATPGRVTLNLAGYDASAVKNLRIKLRESLRFLRNHHRSNFINYMQTVVSDRNLQNTTDILHSLIGFCRRTPEYLNQNQASAPGTGSTTGGSLASPRVVDGDSHFNYPSCSRFTNTTQHTSSTSGTVPKKHSEPVETTIITQCFKKLVTRMAGLSKELKLQENTSLYCDIRRLIDFIRYNYNNVFRSILLSALIDCAKSINQQQEHSATSGYQSMRRGGDHLSSEEESLYQQSGGVSSGKKDKLPNGGYDAMECDATHKMGDVGAVSSSSLIPNSSFNQNTEATFVSQHRTSFESCKFYSPGHPKYNKSVASNQALDQQDQQHSQSTGILSLSKAKKKLEQVFGGGKTVSKSKLDSGQMGDDFAQSGSIATNAADETYNASYDDASRRASMLGYQSFCSIPENTVRFVAKNFTTPEEIQMNTLQLIYQRQQMYACVKTGMSVFSFLMESCTPGDFLDPPILAALLDLKSPIAVRAAIFMECANFVHRCNRGQWPSWMRMNITTHRNSNVGLGQSMGGIKHRKSSSMQRTARSNTHMYRAAGRAFYSWAEAVGTRLEELLLMEQEEYQFEDFNNQEEPQCMNQPSHTGLPAREQVEADIDFFQHSLNNSSSPFSLKMAACQLLFEVTTFLRETYRYLPPSIANHQPTSLRMNDKMASIYDVSRAVTANRRWSMALSSLGFGQLPASLSAISASASNQSSASGLRNLASNIISEQPERRISFILHETNDENEQSDHRETASVNTEITSHSTGNYSPANIAEQQQETMKKMASSRHLSQSSASSAVVVATATCLLRSGGVIDSQTHRRKSIKLKKANQEKDKRAKFAQDLDEELENSSTSDAGLKRTESLKSRRRVSGISEKSDASDQRTGNGTHGMSQDIQQVGDMSGDDSGGNGSCDEGPNYENSETDEIKIMSNMPWFKAIALVNSNINCRCIHYPSCKSNCYKVLQNMCEKLLSSVSSIYQDMDIDQAYAKYLQELQMTKNPLLNTTPTGCDAKSSNMRTGSDCSTSVFEAEMKRREKKSKKHQLLDSPMDDQVSPRSKKNGEKYSNKMSSGAMGSQVDLMSGPMSMNDALRALIRSKAKQMFTGSRSKEDPIIVKYIKFNVRSLLHCPMSSFLKGAVILQRDSFVDMIKFSWNLLLEDDQQISRTAAVAFIISAIKCPNEASKMLLDELNSLDASQIIAAINKFYVIWDARYQCWPRLEDGAFVHFKMAPPSIEFTLPSPKIAQESRPVVDPPWLPRKTSNVEEVTIGQDQTVQRSFVTATKTRRKQQIEIVTKALREKYDKLREEREHYHITSVPITLYAAYEPTLGNQPGSSDDLDGTAAEDETQQENRALVQMKTAQALFPTCLCQTAIVMINLLDDSRVTFEGSAVYEVANKVIWTCLVEDPALFLRYFFERLTRQNQNTIFQVLRRLIRFMPRLPSQAAYTLYNYLIGFIIYYIRCPVDYSQKLISDTLSVLCLVVPSVYGLFLKDLKQILRKEQCDHNLLITANVPSAKKIIVHGSDSSGIPSQFPIDESTQFYHILVDSLEFFGIDKDKQNEYFLIDVRTNFMHNLHSYVRDYYSFKRSQHPQLQLINMDPSKAFDILQRQELTNQFVEFGKVSMSLSIVKTSHMAVQRVLFLHEELMKLPTFPRKALETNFCLLRGQLGNQVFSMDRIHKICWVRLFARMFELTSGFFLQLGDIHLFLNAICGIFVLHCEEASVSRLCLATFLNAAYQFKTIFATDGFTPIMATIVQVYSNYQNNQLLCRSIEFVCKQFYIMHRKPFLLQLFGSVASRLNTAELMCNNQSHYPLATNRCANQKGVPNFLILDANSISPSAFFRLLQSLEKAFKDPLDILELVDAEKPLRAVDFCYQQDKEAIEILDIISLCVTVTAYASDSPRSTQMLIILETVVPLYIKHLQACTSKKNNQSMGKLHKDELQKIQNVSACLRTLIVNCEGLTRSFNGPLPSLDLRSSSIRRSGNAGHKSTSSNPRGQMDSSGSPMDVYDDEMSNSADKRDHGHNNTGKSNPIYRSNRRMSSDETEITRGEFIVPRDTLLNLVAEFLSLSTGRFIELSKKCDGLQQKHPTCALVDVKSHLRLAEVANSLLKFASTDPTVMACRGLTRYMNEILPNIDWRQEAIRPALIMILKRLDKTFNRISKKNWVKRSTDWEGAKQLLKGVYLTFIRHKYIVYLPHLKSLIASCQNIILSDGLQSSSSVPTNLFHGFTSSQSAQLGSLAAAASQATSNASQQTGAQEKQNSNLLNVSTSCFAPGATLSPSGSGKMPGSSSPATSMGNQNQSTPSFAAVTRAAQMAERLATGPSHSISSQSFNSVTIRLIAMQLLQNGETQTLESMIGNFLNTPEKLESLMLNLIYPMCIRVCSGAREAPKLRSCDIMFILNIVLNLLAPQSSSSKSCSQNASSPKTTTDTSQFILSKITTTIGSTQTGATALGIVSSASHSATSTHSLAQHQEGIKIGFLGLKILCVCFETQLATEWIRISRVIRDLAFQAGQPSGPLWDFLDFVVTYRFPMLILLQPMIKCQLAKKIKTESKLDNRANWMQCQELIEAKLYGATPTVCRSKSFLFVSLTAELRMLKDQLINKRRSLLEGERLNTHAAHQQSQNSAGGSGGGLNPNQGSGDGTQGDHFTAYHRLSAAIASLANQSAQVRLTPGGQQVGTSAALKGAACFAAQLATSTPLAQMSSTDQDKEAPHSTIKLSTAKSREEARKVMNTILRRTSYPYNQGSSLIVPEQGGSHSAERKNSQPPSPSSSAASNNHRSRVDLEAGIGSGNQQQQQQQVIMDPGLLMSPFPAPRKSTATEGFGILKQLLQTIDRQKEYQSKQSQNPKHQSTELSLSRPSLAMEQRSDSDRSGGQQSRSQEFSETPAGHRHENPP